MNDMGFKTFEKMYQSCVCPILDYCSPVWGHIKANDIECVQNRAMRIFLGVHRFAPTAAMIGDTGWVNCYIRRMSQRIKYWNRLIAMEDYRLTKIVFNFDYDYRAGKCWSTETLEIFKMLTMEDIYESRTECHIDYLSKMIDQFFSKWWIEQVESKPKLRMYKQIKSTPVTELYLKNFTGSKLRSCLAQIRFGILPLNVETGRFRGTPLEERICTCCDMDAVENECHFLFECELYEELRRTMLNQMNIELTEFNNVPEKDKLEFVFSKPKLLARFITFAMEKRREKLYI